MSETIIADYRQQKDHAFKHDPQSPLTPTQRATFTGLSYYDYNPALDLTIHVTPFDTPEPIQIMTSTNEIRTYERYARFSFQVEDQTAELTIYRTPHGFFLPFVDASANTETYGAGRHLDLEELPNHTFYIDFNLAYNPLCIYNDCWSCPLTPAENRLKIAIRAGEKLPTGEWL